MWSVIEYHPKWSSEKLKYRCDWLVNNMPAYDKKAMREMEDARHAFGSLRTEGSTLTFEQTSMILRGELPKNSPSKDVAEALALAAALKEVRALAGVVPFSEAVVKRIHKTCSNGLLEVDQCGEYKKKQNYVGRGNYLTAATNQVPKRMKQLFEAITDIENPIIKAAFFGYNYVSIHPFIDFNGRTSRLFECYILGEVSLPFISLTENDIEKYLTILRKGQEAGKVYWEPYVEFVADRVQERLDFLKSVEAQETAEDD